MQSSETGLINMCATGAVDYTGGFPGLSKRFDRREGRRLQLHIMVPQRYVCKL
jgi:hypothetical protein